MAPGPRRPKTRGLVGLLLVASLFLVVTDVVVLGYQRRQAVEGARRLLQTKLELLGYAVNAPLLQRRMSTVRSVVQEWSAGNPALVSLRALAPNGFEIVRVDRPDVGGIVASARKDVRFNGTLLLTLEVRERLSGEAERALANAYRFVGASIAITLLLVLSLWITIRRSAIVPLEREIVRREAFERELEAARNELEDRVRVRTAELSQALERLELHIRNTPLAYVEWDVALGVTQWNRSAERIFGRSAAEAIGRNVIDLVAPPAARGSMADDLRALPGMPEGMVRSYVNVGADGGEARCDWYLGPLRVAGGTVVGGGALVHDMTDQRRAEAEQKAAERQLQHAQKLESLGILAGGIAHDFNNILTGMLGYADLALRSMAPETPLRRHVEAIESAARRAADLASQMLAYSGKGRFELHPVDLGEVVREMAHLVEASISKKTVLRFELAEDLPAVEGDPTQLRQVVLNLVVNASEAIGDRGGTVLLRTGTRNCDRDCLAGRWLCQGEKEGPYVFFEVRDDGCGMDEETLAKIFDPFFTTKLSGRGLGLATVMGIVRGHKGALKVGSVVGRGTTFQVLFPRAEPRAAPAPDVAAAGASWQGGGTVLLVDDEELVRDVGRRMLEAIGFRVLDARDGVEALEIFRSRAGDIALVILDRNMPRMDGEETFRELRRVRPDVRVVLCSGSGGEDDVARIRRAGMAGFLRKPYRLQDLSAAARRALDTPIEA